MGPRLRDSAAAAAVPANLGRPATTPLLEEESSRAHKRLILM